MWNHLKSIWSKLKNLWQLALNTHLLANQEQRLVLTKKLILAEQEVESLKKQLLFKQNAKFDREFLWLDGERICLKCYDSSSTIDRQVIRLVRNDPKETESFFCVHCRTTYTSIAAQKRSLAELEQLNRAFRR